TTIDAPGSAVPVTSTPAVASPESTTLSPATVAIIGAAGAPLSTVASSVPAGPVLPAASVAVALICPAPSASPSPVKVTLQLPLSSAVAVLVVEPQVTAIDEPGSAVPVTDTPAVDSVWSTTLSPATAAMTGGFGAVVSGVDDPPPPPPPPPASAR